MVRQLVQIKASTLLYILFYLSIAVISLLPALAASSKELILLETVERQVETFLRLSHIEYVSRPFKRQTELTQNHRDYYPFISLLLEVYLMQFASLLHSLWSGYNITQIQILVVNEK